MDDSQVLKNFKTTYRPENDCERLSDYPLLMLAESQEGSQKRRDGPQIGRYTNVDAYFSPSPSSLTQKNNPSPQRRRWLRFRKRLRPGSGLPKYWLAINNRLKLLVGLFIRRLLVGRFGHRFRLASSNNRGVTSGWSRIDLNYLRLDGSNTTTPLTDLRRLRQSLLRPEPVAATVVCISSHRPATARSGTSAQVRDGLVPCARPRY